MFAILKNRIFKKLKIRLTILYIGIFSILLLVIYSYIHVKLNSALSKQTDSYLSNQLIVNWWLDNIYTTMKGHVKVEEKVFNTFSIRKNSEENYSLNYAFLDSNWNPLVMVDTSFFNDLIDPLNSIKNFFITDTAFLNSNTYSDTTINNIKFKKTQHYSFQITSIFSKTDETKYRIGCRIFNDGNVLIVCIKLQNNTNIIVQNRNLFLLVFIILLLFGGTLGYIISRKAMSGVERITSIAKQIGKSDLISRIPEGNEGEEIEQLASTFNSMLDRIKNLIRELKEVSDNIAHDLRTSVTKIRGILETTITSNGNINEYRQSAGDIIEECDRLILMINTMLEITETDSGGVVLEKDELKINSIVEDAIDLFKPLAQKKNIKLHLVSSENDFLITGNKSKIQRVVANIIDNSIKYSNENSEVLITIFNEEDEIHISFKDNGIGISNEEQLKIFERFYRCEQSRTSQGNGLGLSLAQSIIHAYGGKILVESELGKGSIFTIVFNKI